MQDRDSRANGQQLTADSFIALLLSLPGMGRAELSPDGRRVAWTWTRKAPSADVYAAPTDGSEPPRRLTATPADTYLVSWTRDSRSLVVAEDRGGSERLQLFRLALESPSPSGTMTPLTEPAPPYFLRGGEIEPSGRYLVYAANLDPATGTPIEASWVIRHDLTTGERVAVGRPERPHNFAPDLNEAGTRILYSRRDRDPAGRQVWLASLDGSFDREILDFGAAVKASASWFPDSRRILVVAEAGTHKRLGVYDSKDGRLAWLLDDPARALEGAFVERGGRIVMTEVREARSRSILMDPETGGEQPIAAAEGTLLALGELPDGAWLGRLYGARQPDDLVRFRPATAAIVPERHLALPFAGSRVTRADLAAPEDFRWRSVDGLPIQGWLYRPQAAARGLVVQVHGGPTMHSADAFVGFVQACLAAGFAVLDPNYRGSTGFGLAFREAIRKDGWGGLEQEDIRTGAEAAIAAGAAPPGKVAVTGTSYGGYSAWCAATRWPRSLLAAAAPICGMTDLVIDYYSTRPDLRPYSEEMLGGSPETAPERYRERSPIHFVERISSPLLIVQGMNDPNVTPDNLRAVEAALQAAGIRYETLLFADEGHGIKKPENLAVLWARLIDFFGRAFVL